MGFLMNRGDIVICVLKGDYGKPRPAVVIQSDLFNLTHTSITICPITSYLIYLRQNDGVSFSLELGGCDGSQSQIIASTTCSISVTTLRAAPFNIPWGSSVYARV